MRFKRTKLYLSDNKTETYEVLQCSSIYSPANNINIKINIYLFMVKVHTIFTDLRHNEVCRPNPKVKLRASLLVFPRYKLSTRT